MHCMTIVLAALAVLVLAQPIGTAQATVPMPKGKDGCGPEYQTMGNYCFPMKYREAMATSCTTSTAADGATRTTCRDASGKTTTCTSRRNATGTTYTTCR
jgi:hypothetical protein